jgi:hypothetical protein
MGDCRPNTRWHFKNLEETKRIVDSLYHYESSSDELDNGNLIRQKFPDPTAQPVCEHVKGMVIFFIFL